MSYKQIKWMIIILPTLAVGLWEYMRHTFLMPYISMDAGNILSPIFVFLISITLLSRLFRLLEHVQEELNKERAEKASVQARDLIARELHDGIAQSLFLLSVKIDKAESGKSSLSEQERFRDIRKTVHEVNRYVRQSIANLRFPSAIHEPVYEDTMKSRIEHTAKETLVSPRIEWSIPDTVLSTKEKVELLACIREALMNIHKHAQATQVAVSGQGEGQSWQVHIDDNGKGITQNPFDLSDRYGLRIMKERAEELQWGIKIIALERGSRIEINKEADSL
ncbi:sensor histidine kinase [Paenibacillus pini]|uniref:histidine kinase n=1 Tax=Paenibacillus pini JCM 16418 TaxID=1236976 RepID=W7YZJ0_9BACL|nr:histidine kinase [Paenibacillus pini]GAF07804.1 nitrate/nitrite sensor protein [Paenibacillus pini JCM 16418]